MRAVSDDCLPTVDWNLNLELKYPFHSQEKISLSLAHSLRKPQYGNGKQVYVQKNLEAL